MEYTNDWESCDEGDKDKPKCSRYKMIWRNNKNINGESLRIHKAELEKGLCPNIFHNSKIYKLSTIF